MKKKLLSYLINGQKVGIDLLVWNSEDLNGNQAFKTIFDGETIPNDYADISSIKNWDCFGSIVCNDYLDCKSQIKILVNEIGWNSLTNEEKDIAIKYYAYNNPVDAVNYLISEKGMSQEQAQIFLLQSWHKHHSGVIKSCKQRWYYVKFIIPMFLKFEDCEDLFQDPQVTILVTQLNELGLLGTEAGDNRSGIINFVDSTGDYVGNGLREKDYTLLQGTWDDLIQAIKNVMVEGIYLKYDN